MKKTGHYSSAIVVTQTENGLGVGIGDVIIGNVNEANPLANGIKRAKPGVVSCLGFLFTFTDERMRQPVYGG